MKKLGFVVIAACSLFAVACASETSVDELAGPEETEPADGKGDISQGGVHTYFEISRDTRKCSFPLCSGFHLDRLNASSTKCHDGSTAEQCYVPELDWSESGLSQPAIAKLEVAAAQSVLTEGVQTIVRGRFVVTEAWLSQSDSVSSGVFTKVADNGVRCIAAPCPSTGEKALNTSRTANIAEIDFTEAGVDDAVLEGVSNDMFEPHGVIIAGDRYNFTMEGRKGKGRTATAVYRRLKDDAQGTCFVGGCSGQICSDQEGVISTCEFRPEYACYADATCERAAGGECGWTETPELDACLAHLVPPA